METLTKVIKAVNNMVKNHDKVSNAFQIKGGFGNYTNEIYYFVYDHRFKWSIARETTIDPEIEEARTEYVLTYYPGDEELRAVSASDFQGPSVRFASVDFKTREATESLQSLFQLLGVKQYDVDKVLDTINNENWL